MEPTHSQYEYIFQKSVKPHAIIGKDYTFIKVSGGICDLLEYTESELLQKKFTDVTHPDDIYHDVSMCEKLISGKLKSYQMLKRYITKSNNVILSKLFVLGIYDEQGNLLYFYSIIEPIRQFVQDEKILKLSIKDLILDNWKTIIGLITIFVPVIFTFLLTFYNMVYRLDILENNTNQANRAIIEAVSMKIDEIEKKIGK